MIDINMSDVISVIESCRWYLIALAVILVIAIITSIVCRKANIVLRGLIRKEAAIVAIAAIAVIANLICFGPMSTLLTLSLGGSGTISGNHRTDQHRCRDHRRRGHGAAEERRRTAA